MNHILREIKLSKLTDTPMSTKATMLVEFWDELWADMKVKINPSKGEIRCWKDGYDYYYFYQNGINDHLWCDYNKVWTFFRRYLGLNYGDTQELVHQMVDKTLKCKVNTPDITGQVCSSGVDKTLKCKVNTPDWKLIKKWSKGGQDLKCKVNHQYVSG